MTETVARPTSKSDLLEQFVQRQIARLWDGYHRDVGSVVAELARLRHALPAGRDVELPTWQTFSRGFPEELAGTGDDASPGEYAGALTLSLYALHQQSRRDTSVHARGPAHSLGVAARTLHGRIDSAGVERRMQALIRANTPLTVAEHLRGIVTLLRTHQVPLDYAQLARDLYGIQFTDGHRSVRIRWSRDFYRYVASDGDDTTNPAGAEA